MCATSPAVEALSLFTFPVQEPETIEIYLADENSVWLSTDDGSIDQGLFFGPMAGQEGL
jgi:hypothetical protein